MSVEFKKVSENEYSFEYKGYKLLLVEKDRGVYGIGRAVQLYKLEGLKKHHLKEIGWTKKDNHNGENCVETHLKGVNTWDTIKKGAIDYLDKIS